MLDIKYLVKELEAIKPRMVFRCDDEELAAVIQLHDESKAISREYDHCRHRQRELQSGLRGFEPKSDEFNTCRTTLKQLSAHVKDLDSRRKTAQVSLTEALMNLPNVPYADVPIGTDESDNLVVSSHGQKPIFDFEPQVHWDIGEALGILNFEQASKITGARFCVYHGLGARMERALMSFMLDTHVDRHGYSEVLPPFMVNSASMRATGQLPKFEDDAFKVNLNDYFLVPTAEVPVTNLHRDELLDAEDLPIKYAAYTPCFRREAGSHGRDVRGLTRTHQFQKIELVQIVDPKTSNAVHEELTQHAANILEALGLHYRKVLLCSGDLGFGAAKCYDLEVWLPGQNEFREISSCSNYDAYQARRSNMRFRPEPKAKPIHVHTLNGSGLAVGRTVLAILENYQRADGGVDIPHVLVPYMGGHTEIAPK